MQNVFLAFCIFHFRFFIFHCFLLQRAAPLRPNVRWSLIVMEMEKLVSLCKRRGFLFQSSEIYGGLNGFWDYGPLGVELKRNVKEAWWRDMVTGHDDLTAPPGAPEAFEM